jgi:hypothetical protein
MHTLESDSDQNIEQRKRFRTQRYRSAASGAPLGDLALDPARTSNTKHV